MHVSFKTLLEGCMFHEFAHPTLAPPHMRTSDRPHMTETSACVSYASPPADLSWVSPHRYVRVLKGMRACAGIGTRNCRSRMHEIMFMRVQ